MPDTIFKATYSGVPVYEMMCKGVAVMRRRSDSWLNATQILKVAGFDKPQRTRVLEREVQKGEHEKVQGGYGKYQGTWIPLSRGLALAKQYNIDVLLRPITEYEASSKSPPLAPKHLVANSQPKAPRPSRAPVPAALPPVISAVNTRSTRKQINLHVASDPGSASPRGSEDGSMTSSPSEGSSSSRTPSPFNNHGGNNRDRRYLSPSPVIARGKPNKRRRGIDERYGNGSDGEHGLNGINNPATYGDQILEYFISDTNQIPQLLINPPADFDPDMAIDDEGHTALHWACAMGRLRVTKLLLSAGAGISKVNKAGQTALMRSVMFANNYDVRKFPELYELLQGSTLNIDNHNRTVFHHIVDVAMTKGKSHASRYYMETVLNRLADYPTELSDIINFQDEDGETALTMAARCRSKRLVKILIDHGADPKIANNDGKSTEDYILEDERFRSSPAPPSRSAGMSYRSTFAAYPSGVSGTNYGLVSSNMERPPLHHSVTGQQASTRCVNDMTSMLDSLAASFDQELKEKERDMAQAQALLANIQAEILESQRAVGHLKTQAADLPQMTEHLITLDKHLLEKMNLRYQQGWKKWIVDEEAREASIRSASNGMLLVPGPPDSTDAMNVDKAQGPEVISDLLELHATLPTDSDAIRKACEAARADIEESRLRRERTFEELVRYQAEAGTSGRMAEYRRLIGAGCGVPPAEVDNYISMFLENLESEEPSSSAAAWGVKQYSV